MRTRWTARVAQFVARDAYDHVRTSLSLLGFRDSYLWLCDDSEVSSESHCPGSARTSRQVDIFDDF
jgi:G:T-mismatch repair DNA endonuclease (very short patch repair protein)